MRIHVEGDGVLFRTLDVGAVYMHNQRVYMRTEDSGGCNAVALANGCLVSAPLEMAVTPCDGDLTVRPE